jgi:lipoprotein-releasing system ATP-binding protein
MSDKCLYQIDDISKKIKLSNEDIIILKNISFDVKKGESVAIVGASGSGKTTLLHLMGGLDSPTSGKIIFKGLDITLMDEGQRALFRNKYIGFVFQFHHLLPEFSVLENVAMPLLIRGLSKKVAYKKAEEIIELIGMGSKQHQMVPTLSGGERQLVAIARALVIEPEVILADEPTGNLDYANARKVGDILHRLNQEMGIAIVMVTHNIELASRLERTLSLKNGKLV